MGFSLKGKNFSAFILEGCQPSVHSPSTGLTLSTPPDSYHHLPPTFSLQPWCNISSVQLNGDPPQSQPGLCQRYFRARVFPSQTSGDRIVPASTEQSKQPSILTNCSVVQHYQCLTKLATRAKAASTIVYYTVGLPNGALIYVCFLTSVIDVEHLLLV